MKKVIIGIYADTFNGKVGQSMAYMQFFNKFGYVRMISAADNLENIVNELDMLVIPGGADVDATLYGAIPGVMDSRVNQHYEYLDKVLIPQFIVAEKPIVGICRGLQRLNVHFNGTLNQHIIGHHQGDNRVDTKQKLQIRIQGENVIEILVNSLHHQAIDRVGEGLEVIGWTQAYRPTNHIQPWQFFDKNGARASVKNYHCIPEIIRHTELPIIAFQYHPEEFDCPFATQMIELLIEEKKEVAL